MLILNRNLIRSEFTLSREIFQENKSSQRDNLELKSARNDVQNNPCLGQHFEGGIVFHLWEDRSENLHGLIVSLEKSETFFPWSNLRNEGIGSSAQSAWNGLANTLHIVQQSGHLRSCAEYCLQLHAQGFNDWYLPSIDELHLLWINRYNVNKALESIKAEPILFMDQFVSSTEACPQKVWMLDFSTGAIGCVPKWMPFRVRAIRQF